MKKLNNEDIAFEEKYSTALQTQVMLADTQNVVVEMGRGSGKTTEIFAPRLLRVSEAMPRSTLLLVGPTYTFLLETIVPGLLSYLAKNYERGDHYEFGKQPPKHFLRPYTEVNKWNHTISFVWGTVVQFVSIDRPESAIGKNAGHVFADETLRIKETDFIERILPTLRGDRAIFGKSCYFGGLTLFSSTPNLENDHDWWLSYEENVDKALVKEIMYVAYRVKVALFKFHEISNDIVELSSSGTDENDDRIMVLKNKQAKHQRFVDRWSIRLNEKRRGQYFYMKGSSFSNLAILSLDYIKNQFKGAKSNIDKAKLSILCIRPNKVRDMFFARFSSQHIYTDSYNYNRMDKHSINDEFVKDSLDLKYCDPNRPLLAGLDPGNFMSIVFGQISKNTLRMFKNMYCIIPDEHHEMAVMIDTFFNNHYQKTIWLYYDRAGNQKKQKYKENPKGDTDAKILKKELELLGWTVLLKSLNQATIFYWQHYFLFSRLFEEREFKVPKLRICQYECEELVSSIYYSGRKKTEDGDIVLDKSPERKLEYVDQAWYSPQIPSAMMYLVYGLFEKWMPDAKKELHSYEGL